MLLLIYLQLIIISELLFIMIIKLQTDQYIYIIFHTDKD